MEHGEDDELRKLLREWTVEDAPPSLDRRVLGRREPWWRFLLAGSIRIPVPLGLAVAAILMFMAAALLRPRPAPGPAQPAISLVDFRPVRDLNVRVIRNHD